MNKILDLITRAHIFALTDERGPAATFAACATFGLGVFLFPEAAQAAGIGQWGRNLKNEMGGVVEGGLYAAYAGGLGLTGFGINKAIAKSKGDNQTTTGSVFGYTLGGPALMMVTYVADTMAESIGGSTAVSRFGR